MKRRITRTVRATAYWTWRALVITGWSLYPYGPYPYGPEDTRHDTR